MKIVFTGGGTGGHFYPLIAVAQEVNRIADEKNLAEIRLYYFSDTPYDETALFEERIQFVAVPAGKIRVSASIKNTIRNFIDKFRMLRGIFVAIWRLYRIYPDVVFGKGGYASFPTLVAAHILRIPIIIHESDTVPGRVNRIASKWATRVAVSYAEASTFFPKEKVAHTGQPIRRQLMHPIREGAYEYLKLESGTPTIFVVGGSSGAQIINDVVVEVLTGLIEKYQVIHQVGIKNIDDMKRVTDSLLAENPNRGRYHVYSFLNPLASSMVGGVASVIVSRAGSQLFEFAGWGIPAIVIPITESNGDHQRQNAYAYARSGACVVIEERNLTPHVLLSEINRIIDNPSIGAQLHAGAVGFAHTDAARVIADELIAIGLEHEK